MDGQDLLTIWLINDRGSGLANQLNIMMGKIIQAVVHHHPLVIFSDFGVHYNGQKNSPLGDIIDLTHLQEVILNRQVAIYTAGNVKVSFVAAFYGGWVFGKDVTKQLKQLFFQGEHMYIPSGTSFNECFGDTVYGMRKDLTIHLRVGNLNEMSETSSDVDVYLRYGEQAAKDITNDLIPRSQGDMLTRPCVRHFDLYCHIIRGLRFQQDLVDQAQRTIDKIHTDYPGRRINVIHIHNEDDALLYWSNVNNLPVSQFAQKLHTRYCALIDQYFSKDDPVFVLTGLTDNPIIHYLLKHNYYCILNGNKPNGQREINAIVDLLTAQACTGTCIGNVNPHTLNGSAFDVLLWQRLTSARRYVFLDLDHIDTPEHVIDN